MKKRILILLLSATLISNISACNYSPDNDMGEGGEESTILITTKEKDAETIMPSEVLSSVPIHVKAWKESLVGKRYMYFYSEINNNPYDLWLESLNSANVCSPKELYMKYLELWENELEASVKNAEVLFPTEIQYNSWKSNLEQWRDSVQNVYKVESEFLGSSEISSLAMLISRSRLMREKTIEVKNFLYRLECKNKTTESAECVEIPIVWSCETSRLKENASDSFVVMEDLLKYFNASVDQNPYEVYFPMQDFAKIDAETPDSLNKIEAIYEDWLHFWELEIAFSVDNGEQLFNDVNEYDRWKSSIEQLENARQTLMRCEFSILICEPLAYIPQNIHFYRQQVIEMKFFLYLSEYQQKMKENIEPCEIVIEWSVKG